MNTEEIIEGYLGNIGVNSIYQGSELIWPINFGNKYMISGAFTTCNGITKNKILRLNGDDTVDNTLYNHNYTSGIFYSLAYDEINKKIYVGGDPSLDGGLVRLNMDGTKDTSFNIGTGFDGAVRSIMIDNINSKIYVGGAFTTYKGSAQRGLVRLNLNGSKDTSFGIGTFNGNVYDIKIDNINKKIYVGGAFTNYYALNRLIRLNMNGSLDYDFKFAAEFNNSIYAINYINNKLYVGGQFTTFQGSPQYGLIRLNTDGMKDTSFNIGTGFDGSGPVHVIHIDNINSKIYVGGAFTTYKGSAQRGLVRLNLNGSKDTSFNVGTGFNRSVNDILVDNEKNKIYITGHFNTYNNQPQYYIARLNMDGSLDNTFNIQLTSSAHAILKYTE